MDGDASLYDSGDDTRSVDKAWDWLLSVAPPSAEKRVVGYSVVSSTACSVVADFFEPLFLSSDMLLLLVVNSASLLEPCNCVSDLGDLVSDL
jgi:hypothetical protein